MNYSDKYKNDSEINIVKYNQLSLKSYNRIPAKEASGPAADLYLSFVSSKSNPVVSSPAFHSDLPEYPTNHSDLLQTSSSLILLSQPQTPEAIPWEYSGLHKPGNRWV